MPLCRLKRIVASIRATYRMPDFNPLISQGIHTRWREHDERVFFWMDTLCVPRYPEVLHSRASKCTILFKHISQAGKLSSSPFLLSFPRNSTTLREVKYNDAQNLNSLRLFASFSLSVAILFSSHCMLSEDTTWI